MEDENDARKNSMLKDMQAYNQDLARQKKQRESDWRDN